MIALEQYVMLSAVLFIIGALGFLVRRNVISTLLSIEVMLNAVNVAFVAFNRMHAADSSGPGGHTGQMFAFFGIAAAAAETAVGLAIVLSLFRIRRTVRSDEADLFEELKD